MARHNISVNLALMLLCCVASLTAAVRLNVALSAVGSEGTPRPYGVGDAFPSTGLIDLAKTTHTVLIFVRSTCIYCSASVPFYQRLARVVASRAPHVRLAVVSSEPVSVTHTYIQANGLTVDDVYYVPFGNTRLLATPTLLLLDRRGKVELSAVGKLTPDEERDVIAAVAGL